MSRRGYTVLLQRDGALESRSFRIPVWAVRAATLVAGLCLLLLIALIGFTLFLLLFTNLKFTPLPEPTPSTD